MRVVPDAVSALATRPFPVGSGTSGPAVIVQAICGEERPVSDAFQADPGAESLVVEDPLSAWRELGEETPILVDVLERMEKEAA